jgi:hypothetical protein
VLRRYLPLLFVVLVALATALLFLVLRDQRTIEDPAISDRPVAPTAGTDGIPEFRVESEEEYQRMLDALGTSTDEIEAWARSQGFPPAIYTSSPGLPLERNYRREREDTMRELVAAGDPWAMQFLAMRIAPEHPLEAIDLYRQAVLRGFAYSAFRLGNLFHDVARWIVINNDDRDEVLEVARRHDPLAHASLGWLLVAEYEAGLPPGAISATLAGFHSADEAIDASCQRAAEYLAEIRAQRAELGIELPARRPPLAVALPPEEVAGYCSPEVFPRADFSGCETIRLVGDAGSVIGHRCR